MTYVKDDWEITRAKGDYFSAEEIQQMFAAWQDGKPPCRSARELRASSRSVRKYYGRFKNGWRPGQPRLHPGSDANYTAPVPKRLVPAPNAMPGITKAQLMGRRA